MLICKLNVKPLTMVSFLQHIITYIKREQNKIIRIHEFNHQRKLKTKFNDKNYYYFKD